MSDRSGFLKKLLDANKPRVKGHVYRLEKGRVYRKVVWEWRHGKLVELPELAQVYDYSGPIALAGGGTPNLRQIHYRVRTDAGAIDAAPTWGAAEDTAFWPGFDTNTRLRLSVENTGTASGAIGGWNIFRCGYSAITSITTTSSFVKAVDASSSADAAAIAVQRLTNGTGTFSNGAYTEDGTATFNIVNGFFSEAEIGLQLLSADLGGGETIDIQSATGNYTAVVVARFTTPEVSGSDFQPGVQLGVAGAAVTNASSITLTTINAVPSGNQLIVVSVADDNTTTTDTDGGDITGVTIDGVAATKAKQFTNGQGAAQAGATVAVYYLQVTGGLSSGISIVASFANAANSDAYQINARAFTVAPGKTVTVEATNQLANDAAALGSLDATTANIECLRVRASALEQSPGTTTNSFSQPILAKTTNSNWSFVWAAGALAGGGSGLMSLMTETTISTGTGDASQTRHGGTPDCASVYVAFRADSSGAQGNATLEGSGSLAVSASQIMATAATLQGAGNLSAATSIAAIAAATFTGSGGLSADTLRFIQAFATMAGAGSLSADLFLLPKIGEASFFGSGILSARAQVALVAAVTLQGQGNLSASASVALTASALFQGVGGLSANATLRLPASATLSGSGDLSVQAMRFLLGAATFSGLGSLSADASVVVNATTWQGAATLAGAGSLSASASLAVTASATLVGSGSLSVATIQSFAAQETLQGAGNLSANARLVLPAFATFGGQGALSIDAFIKGVVAASALFAGSGGMSVATRQNWASFATLQGDSGLSVAASLRIVAAETLQGSGSFAVATSLFLPGRATLQGSGQLSAGADAFKNARATFSGASAFSIDLFKLFLGNTLFQGLGSMSVDTRHNLGAFWTGAGDSSLELSMIAQLAALASLSGDSDLSADAIVLSGGVLVLPRSTTSGRSLVGSSPSRPAGSTPTRSSGSSTSTRH